MDDMFLFQDKSLFIKAHLRSLKGQWLASKSPKDHLLQFSEHFYVSQTHRDFVNFILQFKEAKGEHVDIMTRACEFLSFIDILNLAKVNKRLYFVTGHIPLLRVFTQTKQQEKFLVVPRKQEGYIYEVTPQNQPGQFDPNMPVSPPTPSLAAALTAHETTVARKDPNESAVGPPSGQSSGQTSSNKARDGGSANARTWSQDISLGRGGGGTYDVIVDCYVAKSVLKNDFFISNNDQQ